MDTSDYTPRQIMDSLMSQGYSEEQAHRLMKTMGPMKTPEKQDSNIAPNLAEGVAGVGAGLLLNATPLGPFAKLMAQGVAGNIGSLVGADVSGTNYYDKASGAQIMADMGGSLAGGFIGGHLAEGMGKASVGAEKALAAAAARKAGAGIAGKAAGAIGGRTLGGVLGSAAGPIGSIAGATLGGYLLPKLFANNDEKAADPHAGVDGSTIAMLAGAGLLALPMGAGIRKFAKQKAKAANDWTGKVGDDGAVVPGSTWGEQVKDYASPLTDTIAEKTAPLREYGQQWADAVSNTPIVKSTTNRFNTAANKANKLTDAEQAAANAAIDPNRAFHGLRQAGEDFGWDVQRSTNLLGATGAATNTLGKKIVNDHMRGAR
jgi:hypothetical protein